VAGTARKITILSRKCRHRPGTIIGCRPANQPSEVSRYGTVYSRRLPSYPVATVMPRRLAINKQWNGKPAVASPYRVSFSISAMTGDVVIHIDAPFFNDPPPPGEPGKYHKLYNFEVVEVFLAAYPGEDDQPAFSPYLEVQVGPHGHYNLVFFLKEADFPNMDNSLELEKLPTPQINAKSGRWTAEVAVPAFFLPEPVCGDDLSVTWMANAYAIHGTGDRREYLAHSPVPGTEPNFHQLGAFVPVVLFESLETRMTIDRSHSMATERIRASSMAGYGGPSPSAAAAMGLAAGAHGGQDLSSRLMGDVLRSQGGLKGAGIGEGEGDEDGASSGALLFPLSTVGWLIPCCCRC
jgi:hypothetical protein